MIIEQEKLKQSILSAIADMEIIKILDCTIDQPASVHDVIRQTDIPHTTTYRKIKWLLDAGLLIVERIQISPEGKKFSLFRSTLKSINVTHEKDKTVVEIQYNINVQAKIAQRFFSLDRD
jgi:DNA-binding transcriptional ArsR family regulator